ncbi:hypothetical protein D3C73_1416640 [compost metagenome]
MGGRGLEPLAADYEITPGYTGIARIVDKGLGGSFPLFSGAGEREGWTLYLSWS